MMKRLSIVLVLTSFVLLSSCSRKAPDVLTNYPIPSQPDTLRILGWGNSFTDDGMMYLPDLLESAGIHNVILGRLYIGGCSLERHCREMADSLCQYTYYKSVNNRWDTLSTHFSALQGLRDEPWDVVVMQQVSGLSGQYETFHPWLEEMMKAVRKVCPNPRATLAWQQTWAYARGSNHPDFPRYGCSQDSMYQAITSCVARLREDTPISVIVPSGIALQELRNTAFCDSMDFTRDGYHLDYQMGRLTAACCWFETLVAPSFGVTVRDNTFRMQGTPREVSELQALLCREYSTIAARAD